MIDVSQSKEYFLIISAKPELNLGQHFVNGRIVNVNMVVSQCHRRNLTLVKSACETAMKSLYWAATYVLGFEYMP